MMVGARTIATAFVRTIKLKFDVVAAVVDVMKMGNLALRGGIEPTFLASVLTITPWLPDVIRLPTPTCICGSWHERPV